MSAEAVSRDGRGPEAAAPAVRMRVRGVASADEIAAVWAALASVSTVAAAGPLAAWRRGRIAALARTQPGAGSAVRVAEVGQPVA